MFPSGYFLSLSGKLLLRVACTFSLPFGTSHGVQISLCNVGISAPPPSALASSKGISAPGAVSDIPCMSSPQGTRGSWVPSRGFEEGPLAPSHTSSLEPQSSRTCAQFPEPPPSAPAFVFPTPHPQIGLLDKQGPYVTPEPSLLLCCPLAFNTCLSENVQKGQQYLLSHRPRSFPKPSTATKT